MVASTLWYYKMFLLNFLGIFLFYFCVNKYLILDQFTEHTLREMFVVLHIPSLRVCHILLFILFLWTLEIYNPFKILEYSKAVPSLLRFRQQQIRFIILHWTIYGEIFGFSAFLWGHKARWWCHREMHVGRINARLSSNNIWNVYLDKVWIRMPGIVIISSSLLHPKEHTQCVHVWSILFYASGFPPRVAMKQVSAVKNFFTVVTSGTKISQYFFVVLFPPK